MCGFVFSTGSLPELATTRSDRIVCQIFDLGRSNLNAEGFRLGGWLDAVKVLQGGILNVAINNRKGLDFGTISPDVDRHFS